MSETKKNYHVKHPVLHDRHYAPGSKIALTEDEAAPLLHAKVIALHDEQKAAPATTPAETDVVDIDKLKKEELVEYAKANNIAVDANAKKEDILALVKEAQTK